jgi:hypothetical protein
MALNQTSCGALNTTLVIGDVTGFQGGPVGNPPKLSTAIEAGVVGAVAGTFITAAVEIKSTLGGLVVARMTQAQRDAMPANTVADGTLVYVTDLNGLYIRQANAWVNLSTFSATGYLSAAGGFRASEAANGKQGVATLVAGTVVVANTSITANSRIIYSRQAPGGGLGNLSVTSIAGTSFTILSSSNTETSVIAYEIFEPA